MLHLGGAPIRQQLAAPGLAARSRRQAAGAGAPASRSTPRPPPPASVRHPLPAGRVPADPCAQARDRRLPGGRAHRRTQRPAPWDRRLPAGRAHRPSQRPPAWDRRLPAGRVTADPSGHPPGTAVFQKVSQEPNRSAPPWWSPHPAQLAAPGLAARSRRQAAGAGAPASRSTPGPPPPASIRHPLPAGRAHRPSQRPPAWDRRLPAGRVTADPSGHPPGTAVFQKVSQEPNRSAPPWWSPHPAQLAAPGLAARSRRQAAGAGAPASRSTPGPPPPASIRHPLPAGREDGPIDPPPARPAIRPRSGSSG